MKKNKIIYWASTGIVGTMMLFTAFKYLTNQEMKEAFVHLGFPDYFRIELAIAKIIGAILVLIPAIPNRIKDLAYFGFAMVFISAVIAHSSLGDPIIASIMPLAFLGILSVSYFNNKKVLNPL
ncbi:DoxX family protein [Dyadobacter sp. 3J3]|uniref:DoxX family protein n=1 Tax=Dyadobacter sp. 3J3 TaxID=2606600 RepID=UPI001356B58C|nr:DoxX family protein [Dyadobacter sp. 3J3]